VVAALTVVESNDNTGTGTGGGEAGALFRIGGALLVQTGDGMIIGIEIEPGPLPPSVQCRIAEAMIGLVP